ncbi:hypothetical protein [Acidocella sp. C78]|uniref:hypothetical protein n=1 Tax=Acidocella sp. C78 TaxID=1671486 RepID=UPI00191B916E|nr:hypothetical protein [Acidocella sp. C78]
MAGRSSRHGGVVLLSAAAKDALLRTVVNESGIIEAGSAVSRAGRSRCWGRRATLWCRAGWMRLRGAGGAVAVSGAHVVVAHGGRIVATGRSAAGRSRWAAACMARALPQARTVKWLPARCWMRGRRKCGRGRRGERVVGCEDPASMTRVAARSWRQARAAGGRVRRDLGASSIHRPRCGRGAAPGCSTRMT